MRPALLKVAALGAAALVIAGGSAYALTARTVPAYAGPVQADPPPAGTQQGWLGLLIAPLTDQVKQRLNLPAGAHGVVVMRAMPGSPAAAAGIKDHDLVTAVGGTSVDSPAALKAQLQSVKAGDSVQLTVVTAGQAPRTVQVTAAAPPAARPGKQGGHDPGLERGGSFGGALPFFGGLPGLDALKDVPADQRFDHVLGGDFSVKDSSGQTVTIHVIPGKVVNADSSSISITPNDSGRSGGPYSVTANTRKPASYGNLKAGDRVIIVTRDTSSEAVAVIPIMQRQPRPATPGNGNQPPGQNGGYQGGKQDDRPGVQRFRIFSDGSGSMPFGRDPGFSRIFGDTFDDGAGIPQTSGTTNRISAGPWR